MSYTVNGRTLTAEEFAEHTQRRVRLHGGIEGILESGKAPGGHEAYWGATGHVSDSAGVPAHQAAEHQKWLEDNNVKGIEVQKDGSVKANSPGNWKDYLKARGLEDCGTAGSKPPSAKGSKFVR